MRARDRTENCKCTNVTNHRSGVGSCTVVSLSTLRSTLLLKKLTSLTILLEQLQQLQFNLKKVTKKKSAENVPSHYNLHIYSSNYCTYKSIILYMKKSSELFTRLEQL